MAFVRAPAKAKLIAGAAALVAAVACGGGDDEAETTTTTSTTIASDTTTTTAASATYTVQPGDTLTEIGRRFGTSVEALVEANDIENPDVLEVGQVLEVPGAPPP